MCVQSLTQENPAEADPKGRRRLNSPSEPWVLLSMETPSTSAGRVQSALVLSLTDLYVCRAVLGSQQH